MKRRALALAAVVLLAGCRSDRCEGEPASFQLDLSLAEEARATPVDEVSVRIRLADRSYSRRFAIDGELEDGETALSVDLEPPPAEAFEIQIWVEASAGGTIRARGEQTFRGSPDGCNRFALRLSPGSPGGDGGGRELGPDALVPDAGRSDGAPADAGSEDADLADQGPPPPEPPCAARASDDDVFLFTFDEVPAFTTTVADARGQHPAIARPEGAMVERAPSREGCGLSARFGEQSYLEVPSHADFDLAAGSLDFWFSAASTSERHLMEGLVSRDASGTARSGHFSIYLSCDGHVVVRLQRTNAADVFRCSDQTWTPEQWVHVGLNFGPPEVELYVNGALQTNTSSTTVRWDCGAPVACGAPSTHGIDGNENPFVLGASSHSSGEGVATPVNRPFRGQIDSFRLSRNRRSFDPAP